MKNKYLGLFSAIFVFAFLAHANAGVKIKSQSSSASVRQMQIDGADMDKDQIISTLKQDIAEIERQLYQCQKSKKGWTAATIVGGVGVVGTGIGALIQNNQIQNKQHELSDAQDELRSLK